MSGSTPAGRTAPPINAVSGSLPARRCQWCATDVPETATRCPACGSPLPTRATSHEQTPSSADDTTSVKVPDLPHFALSPLGDDPVKAAAPDTLADRDNKLLIAVGIVVVCIVLGAAVLPYLLVSPFERVTGIESASASNLRPLGAIIGLLAGMTLALLAGAVTWTSRALR